MKFKTLLYKIAVILRLRSSPGFNQLMYRGVPIIQRDMIPTSELWIVSKNGRTIKKINIETQKSTTIKLKKPFRENWLDWSI